jgi:DNA-binding LacI/PurR family transcriptional regulator
LRSERGKKNSFRRRVSSVDVARHAGVSQASVSRTFANKGNVTEKTKAKVLQAAEELGYNPNAIARGLIQSTTNMIGLVMLRFMNPFYAYLLKQFTSELQKLGYVVLLFAIDDEADVNEALPIALQYYVDGIIITSATLSSKMAEGCVRSGTPVVLFNRYTSFKDINSVRTDNVGGGRAIADFLIDGGHKRIGYLAGEEKSSTNQDRQKGFLERLKEHRYDLHSYILGDYTYESGYELGKRILRTDEPPDALFCANDLMAMGVIDAARNELGIRVPEDVSIVGFDDIAPAQWPPYRITTYRQPLEQLVAETIDVLLSAVKNPDSEVVTRILKGELVIRESARVAN